MFLLNVLLTILPFQNELIPNEMQVWDHRGPETEISIPALDKGKRAFLIASLSSSYENQILNEIGRKTFTVAEWKQAVRDQGYRITHSEVRHGLSYFDGFAEIREWLEPALSSPSEIDQFLSTLQHRGWVDTGDGKIRFPYERLVLVVENVD